jgi:flagellar FliL protein
MSAAPAPAASEGDAPKGGNKKKLIIIGAVVAVALAGGGGAFFMMKKKAADAAAAAAAEGGGEGEDSAPVEKTHKPAAKEHGGGEHSAPTFVPLDPFTVNLSDKNSDRYAQIGLSLQVEDPKLGEELKNYMPAIRNAILMLLSHKSSEDLLTQEGKEHLAQEIRRDAARAMGYDVEDPFEDEEADAAPEPDTPKKKKKKKKKKVGVENPIVQVHYATFIIQ